MDTAPTARPKTGEFAEALDISPPYASLILNEKRSPPLDLALRIHARFGLKLGRLANASDDDIAALQRIADSAPLASEGGGAQPPFSPSSPSSSPAGGQEWPLTPAAAK